MIQLSAFALLRLLAPISRHPTSIRQAFSFCVIALKAIHTCFFVNLRPYLLCKAGGCLESKSGGPRDRCCVDSGSSGLDRRTNVPNILLFCIPVAPRGAFVVLKPFLNFPSPVFTSCKACDH